MQANGGVQQLRRHRRGLGMEPNTMNGAMLRGRSYDAQCVGIYYLDIYVREKGLIENNCGRLESAATTMSPRSCGLAVTNLFDLNFFFFFCCSLSASPWGRDKLFRSL